MGLRKIVLLAGLAFPVIAVAFMNLFSGFTVEREVILNPEWFNIPASLLKASDGGYFVLGSFEELWITKTGAEGHPLWTHRDPPVKGTGAQFVSAAPAADGGVLICGHRHTGIPGNYGGLVIRLDKNGHEVSRIDPLIQHPSQVDQFIGVVTCSRWGDGFMVSGGVRVTERSPEGKTITHGFPTIMRLHNDGTLMWQKNIDGYFENPLIMANDDLVFFGMGLQDSVEYGFLTRMDGDGNIRATVKYPRSVLDAGCRWINHSESSDSLQFVCNPDDPKAKTPIVELGPDLQIIRRTEFVLPDGMGVARAYLLPDGSLVISGNKHGKIQNFIPTLVEVGPDHSIKAEYEFLGLDEGLITDFMPTDKPGEYVTVRPIGSPGRRTAITFLKRN